MLELLGLEWSRTLLEIMWDIWFDYRELERNNDNNDSNLQLVFRLFAEYMMTALLISIIIFITNMMID